MIFIFFVKGGGGGGGVLGVLTSESELEWEMRRTGWRDRWGALCTRVHTSTFYVTIHFLTPFLVQLHTYL
jgi:hypothetical protein